MYKQREVDFIARFASKEYYIQLANQISTKTKEESEYSSLRKIDNSFKKIMILNDNFYSYHSEDGILIISLKEFLLNIDSLNE